MAFLVFTAIFTWFWKIGSNFFPSPQALILTKLRHSRKAIDNKTKQEQAIRRKRTPHMRNNFCWCCSLLSVGKVFHIYFFFFFLNSGKLCAPFMEILFPHDKFLHGKYPQHNPCFSSGVIWNGGGITAPPRPRLAPQTFFCTNLLAPDVLV